MQDNLQTSSRTTRWVIACAVCFLLGVGSTSLYYRGAPTANTADGEHWITLSKPSNENLVTYSSDALFNSDIKLPKVKSLTGKAKFVKSTGNASEIKLGYVVDADIAPYENSEIPDKYQPRNAENAEPKKPPVDVVYYEVVFYFILKDKDGFPLLKVASNKETVHSGAVNHFQLFANTYVSPAIAAHTQAIDVRMEAVKCLTCQPNSAPSSGPVEKHRRRSFFGL